LIVAGAGLAHADDVPVRKPGFWQITSVTPGVGKQVIDACIAEGDNIAIPKDSGDCSEPEVLKAGSETIVNFVCTKGEAKQTMSYAFSGDFKTNYHAVVKITYDPPLPGWGPRFGMTLDAKYKGPDCPDEAKQGH
jgi:hypothetical protein